MKSCQKLYEELKMELECFVHEEQREKRFSLRIILSEEELESE